MKRRPLFVVIGLLVMTAFLPVTGAELGLGRPGGPGGGAATASPTPSNVGIGGSPGASPTPTLPQTGDPGSPGPTPSPTLAPDAVIASVPVVPVTQFRSPRTGTTLKEVTAVLAGTSARYSALELVGADADAILAALGLDRPADPKRLVEAANIGQLGKDLAANRTRLAFVRAAQVGPRYRALAWGGKTLFGETRLTDIAAWPLTASLSTVGSADAFDAGSTWTLLAGGDIMLDRGVYDITRNKGKGADFPFDGGTATITSRYCCSSFGWRVPRLARTGNAGAVRRLISGADIALANFENPAPNTFRWHTHGTIFSADQTLIDGLVNAGFDVVGVANNHIRDQGGTGLLQTLHNLRKRGLLTAGAGKDLAAARKPAIIETHGVKVAILAYDAIAASYHATATKIGSAPMSLPVVTADIAAARAAGADVVIVFPHWGIEYRAPATATQRTIGRAIIDAGADMIIGNHPHWTEEMEVYKGKPIWYALGNLVFDQTWSEETMEGMTLELTFRGKTLVQARIRPHVILDKAQANFLDPATDGKIVMDRIFNASKHLAW